MTDDASSGDTKTPPVAKPNTPPTDPVPPPSGLTLTKDDITKSDEVDEALDLYLSGQKSVPHEDFVAVQKQLIELQEKDKKNEAEKIELERKYALNELKRINPQLAKINEKSSAATIKTVIATHEEIKKGFPSLDPNKETTNKASINDHDTMDYDFEKKQWVYQ